MKLGDNPTRLDSENQSALYYSLMNRKFELVKGFISNGIKIDTVNENNQTILQEIVEKANSLDEILDIIEFLMQENADISFNHKGFPIYLEFMKNAYLLDLLFSDIKYQQIITKVDDNGNNVLHTLFSKKTAPSQEALEILHQHSFLKQLVSQPNKEGITPLLICLKTAELKSCVEVFLNLNILKLNEQDKDGNTPLHIAILSEDKELIQLFMSRGANPNLKNKDNLTCFELYCKKKINDSACTEKLLLNGAIVTPLAFQTVPKNTLEQFARYVCLDMYS